jgi:very-short-patch-repair endonuclease
MKVENINKEIGNVKAFQSKVRELYGEIHKDSFDAQMFHYLYDIGIDSPIEQIFFMALRLQCEEMGFEFTTSEYFYYGNKFQFVLAVYPQKKIGKYKVDFFIKLTQGSGVTELIIELDGHEFHERDKQQRSYEKARDRFLINSGYKVFHYTGSDVVKKPQHVAYEVIKSLDGYLCKPETVEEYDPDNRLGWEIA